LSDKFLTYDDQVAKLIATLDGLANVNTDYAYIVHCRRKHHNVPLWVIMRAATFGQASMMYSFLAPADKAAVAKAFAFVNERELAYMVFYLVLFRNVCAHGERLSSHRAYSDMPDTALHAKLKLPKKGQEYACGKRDLFGCVIALRYLLPSSDFLAFKRRLSALIERYLRDNRAVGRAELYAAMGFPDDWKTITRYHM
jgi:abortive infection bacteriophage resistance protein